MAKRSVLMASAWATAVAGAVHSAAQTVGLPSHVVPYFIDSGIVSAEPGGDDPLRLFAADVVVPGAEWLRISFGDVLLSGDPAGGGAFLLISSLVDGAWQRQNAEHVAQWEHTSAYFNGDALRVELFAYPGKGDNRVVIESVMAGDPPIGLGAADDLCGIDDRVLSDDPRAARHSLGCTAYLIEDLNRQFLTAGHCTTTGASVMSFNVPLSSSTGSIKFPPPEDQYTAEALSIQGAQGSVGNDWRYFGVHPNTNTGLQPFQRQGAAFVTGLAPTSPVGQTIRVTGYGQTAAPVPPEWNGAQKTHAGPMTSLEGTTIRYLVDTSVWNSGSPIIQESTGKAVGIHTHAGCATGGNQGTAMQNVGLQNALAAPKGVCRSGTGAVSPPLYAIGDIANNFGTLDLGNGNFAKLSQDPLGAFWQGLAFDRNAGVFYAVDSDRRLWTIDPVTGAHALNGEIGGTALVLNGLAFDPVAKRLYAVAQSNGQLLRIDPDALSATSIGSPAGGTVGAIEFDPTTGLLYGLDDAAGGTTLVTIDPASGAHAPVGALGPGFTDCNGLAYVEQADALYTIEAGNEMLVRIDKHTGAALFVGPTGGLFGAAFGMSAVLEPDSNPCPADLDGDGEVGQADLGLLLAYFEDCPPREAPCPGDFDGDGDVDQTDLGVLLSAYGQPCP